MFEYLALQSVDRIPHDLPSLALKSTVQNLEHRLLVDVILIINLLQEAAICLPLPLSQLHGIPLRKLIDLLIHFLKVEVVLRRVRARAIRQGVIRVIFFFDFNMLIGAL